MRGIENDWIQLDLEKSYWWCQAFISTWATVCCLLVIQGIYQNKTIQTKEDSSIYYLWAASKLFLYSKGWIAIFSRHLNSLSKRKRIGRIFEAFSQPYNHMSHTLSVDECRNYLWRRLIIFLLRDIQDRKYRTFLETHCVSASLQMLFLVFVTTKNSKPNQNKRTPNWGIINYKYSFIA